MRQKEEPKCKERRRAKKTKLERTRDDEIVALASINHNATCKQTDCYDFASNQQSECR